MVIGFLLSNVPLHILSFRSFYRVGMWLKHEKQVITGLVG